MTDRPAPDKTTSTVTTSVNRGVGIGGNVTNSKIYTGDVIEAPDPLTTSLHQLRAPVGDFVGREQEIDTLINALRRESRACITGISGMGGIGKTELAPDASKATRETCLLSENVAQVTPSSAAKLEVPIWHLKILTSPPQIEA